MIGNSIGSLQPVALMLRKAEHKFQSPLHIIESMEKSAKEIQAASELCEEEKINTQNKLNQKMSRKSRYSKIKTKEKKPLMNTEATGNSTESTAL